jgi:exonuclease VII large subunit
MSKEMRLDDISERLPQVLLQKIEKSKYIVEYAGKVLKPPKNILSLAMTTLPFISKNLKALISQKINVYKDHVLYIEKQLSQNSYSSILKRGFCIVTNQDGSNLTSAKKILEKRPASVDVHFFDGKIKALPHYT